MGFVAFVGRVLFASIFLLSAYQEFSEFGSDGGPAARYLKPKFNRFVNQVSANIGTTAPHINIKTVIAASMFLKACGGLLLIISSSFGASLLDVHHYCRGLLPSDICTCQTLPSQTSAFTIVHLAFITPVVYDFYNHDMESQQFAELFTQFSQNLALLGALLFFLGMKNSIPRRHSKRRAAKAKTT
ncbi:unnamed protein product [Alopecurus aequalis]